jgi:hypothetical protein
MERLREMSAAVWRGYPGRGETGAGEAGLINYHLTSTGKRRNNVAGIHAAWVGMQCVFQAGDIRLVRLGYIAL